MKDFNDISYDEMMETALEGEMALLLITALEKEKEYAEFKIKQLNEILKKSGVSLK